MSEEARRFLIAFVPSLVLVVGLLIPLYLWWCSYRVRQACELITRLCRHHYRVGPDGIRDTNPSIVEMGWLNWAMDIVDWAAEHRPAQLKTLLDDQSRYWAERKLHGWHVD